MADSNQRVLDRFDPLASPGDGAVDMNLTKQQLSPEGERILSANPPPDCAISVASRNTKEQPTALETTVALTTMQPFNSYTPQDQGFYYGGYNNGGNWNEQSNYVNANNLHVIPPMAFGQFSPLASPISPILFDGQLFSPHQIPATPPYYPPPMSPGPPHVTSALQASKSQILPQGSSSQESFIDNAYVGPGSGYYLSFGSFGGGDLSGSGRLGLYQLPGEYGSSESFPSRSNSLDSSRFMSPLTSGTVFPQPIGILGPYERNVAQSFELMPNSSASHFAHGGPYQRAVGSSFTQNGFVAEKVGRHERDDQDKLCISTDAFGISNDRTKGPRASKPKIKSSSEEGTSSSVRDAESTSGFHIDQFNSSEFITEYEHAIFFVIKSFSEENIHKSIKYNAWASTPHGNRKLDTAYRDAKEIEGVCPVFLFFSVNASGQFCGVAEMVGPVDFEKDADYWQQDRWSGQFPIKWHIVKDVPNSLFRRILLENNENKPVTHSRDSQEVKLSPGIEMLKIFKNHDAETSLLDDFSYYDEREKTFMERKAKQQASKTGNTTVALATESINQLSDNLADTLHLEKSVLELHWSSDDSKRGH